MCGANIYVFLYFLQLMEKNRIYVYPHSVKAEYQLAALNC